MPRVYPYPGYCAEGLTGLKEVPGTVMSVWNNSQKTELTDVPGIVARAYRTHRSSGQVQKRCTGTPGIVKRGVQNLQKFCVGYFPGIHPVYGSVG